MGLVLQLVETRADGGTRSVELMELGPPGNLRDIADLGLTLPEAKQLLACVQQAVVVVQARDHATLWPDCASCGERFEPLKRSDTSEAVNLHQCLILLDSRRVHATR